MKYDKAGEYTLVYKATDECGNTTEQIRNVVVEEVTPNIIVDEDLSVEIPRRNYAEAGLSLTQLQNVAVGDNLTLTLKTPVVIYGDSGIEFAVDGDLTWTGDVLEIDGIMICYMWLTEAITSTPPFEGYITPDIQLINLNNSLSISVTDDGGEESPVMGITASHILVEKKAGE